MESSGYKAETAPERGYQFMGDAVRRKGKTFPRQEVEAALKRYCDLAGIAITTGNYSDWANVFTEDAIYIEPSYGIIRGRQEIFNLMNTLTGGQPFALKIADQFHLIDNDLIMMYAPNWWPAPDGGDPYQWSTIAVLCYGGEGQFCYEEDIYSNHEQERMNTAYFAALEAFEAAKKS